MTLRAREKRDDGQERRWKSVFFPSQIFPGEKHFFINTEKRREMKNKRK